MLRKTFLFFALSAGLFAGEMPVVDSLEAALPIAQKEKRTIILNFTGKEWCPACVYLRTRIFASDEFKNKVGDKYIEAEVIFPRQPDAVQALGQNKIEANEQLYREYGLNSGMPTMVLHDEQGKPFAIIIGARRTPAEFIQALDDAQVLRVKRDAAFAKAAGLQGTERAKLLAEALNALPENFRHMYEEQVNEINAADPDNTLGYKHVLVVAKLYAEQDKKLREILKIHTARLQPDELRAELQELRAFLTETQDVQPEIAQKVWQVQSEVNALLRDYKEMVECLRRAIEAAPNSKQAPRLRANLEHVEKYVIPYYNTHCGGNA